MVDFLCDHCGKMFSDEIDLALHEARAYDKRSVKCEKCATLSVVRLFLERQLVKII